MAASPPGMDPLYDAAPCGLLLADADGLVISANRTLCGWLRSPVEQLVGARRFQDLLTMGGRIFWQTHLQPLLRMQGSVAEVKLDFDTLQRTPKDSARWYQRLITAGTIP